MALGKKTGGKIKGSRNKATLERIERERIAEQIAIAAGQPGSGKAIAKAMDENSVWAKDELAAIIPLLKEIVAYLTNPLVEAAKQSQESSRDKWDHARIWIEVFVNTLSKLAPYQHPTFRAVAVTSDVVDKGGAVRFIVENAPIMIDAVVGD